MPASIRQMAEIEFTPEKHEALRKAHSNAVAKGRDAFPFEGQTLLTRYAGYLLEYLDMRKGKQHGYQRRRR